MYDPYSSIRLLVDPVAGEAAFGPLADAGGMGMSSFLGPLSFLMNPPRPLPDQTIIGQQGQPIITQQQDHTGNAMSGALKGFTAGAPFGPPGMIAGTLIGLSQATGNPWYNMGILPGLTTQGKK